MSSGVKNVSGLTPTFIATLERAAAKPFRYLSLGVVRESDMADAKYTLIKTLARSSRNHGLRSLMLDILYS